MRRLAAALVLLMLAAACGEASDLGSDPSPSEADVPRDTTTSVVPVDSTMPPPTTDAGLEVHHEMDADGGGTFTAQGDTDIRGTEGDGWVLIGVERFVGGRSRVAVASSPVGLDRMWDVYGLLKPKPDLDFEAEMLLALTKVVSGSCPDLRFDGLVITEGRVYGVFEDQPNPQGCTADANPVTFLFVVDLSALPPVFELTVEADRPCPTCQFDSVVVDQSELEALEETLWGPGSWWIALEGTAPEPGMYNAVMFDPETRNALLFSPEGWAEWAGGEIQSLPSDLTTLVEAYVATCEGEQCEECLGEECDLIERVGEGCKLEVVPEPFADGTVWITFDGTACTITVDVHG